MAVERALERVSGVLPTRVQSCSPTCARLTLDRRAESAHAPTAPGPRLTDMDQETEKAVRLFLAMLDGRYDVSDAIVYGSRARGTHRPDSDADVAVILRGERRRFLPTKLALSDVAYDVSLDTGIDISPLPVWLDEWEHPDDYPNPALLRNIATEGIRL